MQNLGWVRWMFEKFKRGVIGLTWAGIGLWLLTLPLVMARFHICTPVAVLL